MSITRICLIRHGETSWNAEHRLQGHQDIPLNATGEAQAKAAAFALHEQPFAAIYSSDLARARVTAETIAQASGQSVHIEPGLRERHFGTFQGLTRDEADRLYPGEYARLRMREPDAHPPGGGESLLVFGMRVRNTLQSIVSRHENESILLVSHGGCLDVIYRMVTGKPLDEPRDFPLGNATVNWIASDNGNWRLITWDERTHLARSADEISI